MNLPASLPLNFPLKCLNIKCKFDAFITKHAQNAKVSSSGWMGCQQKLLRMGSEEEKLIPLLRTYLSFENIKKPTFKSKIAIFH